MGFKLKYLIKRKFLEDQRPSRVIRIYGLCTKTCLSVSMIFAIETIASHHVTLKFKHWNIYIYTLCPYHGSQIWNIEKLFTNVSHISDDFQTFKNYCIFMSCSHYGHFLRHHKLKYATKIVYLDTVADIVMDFKDNGYHFLIDNCLTFKRRIWSRLSRLIDHKFVY